MSDLKPCPKCGSDKIKVGYRWDSLNLAKTYFVYCSNCDIYFNGNYSEDSTVAKWNTRPAGDAKDREIKQLKAENDQLKMTVHNLLLNIEASDAEEDHKEIARQIAADFDVLYTGEVEG